MEIQLSSLHLSRLHDCDFMNAVQLSVDHNSSPKLVLETKQMEACGILFACLDIPIWHYLILELMLSI